MSTKKTENYSLHRWEPADNFLLSEINENFTAIDTAVASENTKQTQALATARTALESQIAAKAKVVAGTYTGNGAASQTIELGFTPVAVLVVERTGMMHMSSNIFGGLTVIGSPAGGTGKYITVQLETNGFSAKLSTSEHVYTNQNNSLYHYIAFA